MTKPMLPPRRVHIPGGLRAVDGRNGKISLEIAPDMLIAHCSAPNYADLYRVLAKWGLNTIGVEFLYKETEQKIRAPDWHFGSPTGFSLMVECKHWRAIRYAAQQDRCIEIAYAASRCSTLLDLLELRIFQLSVAYNHMLRSWFAEGEVPTDGILISNTYLPHIDAAIHAYLADAAVFRDLLSEIVWRFLLDAPGRSTTTFGTFLKTAKGAESPIAEEMVAAGADGGWIKILSGLRDRVVHIAPMGSDHLDHSCRIKMLHNVGGVSLPSLHYPLCGPGGSLPPNENPFDIDPDIYSSALERYADFHETSIDGLSYCWGTINRFIALSSRIRQAASFREEIATIGPDDIEGFRIDR